MPINYLDVTKRVNESLKLKAEKEQGLFKVSIEELMQGIEPVNPLVYYHRLIAKLAPDSEFAEYVNSHDDIANIPKTVTLKRNIIIKEAIEKNIGSNTVELYPGAVFNNVYDALKRTDHGIASGFTRDKCFLIALVFNLTFEQAEYLLMHCLGEQGFNYKNPYEVMLAYCFIDHTNSYERYCTLKERYEKAKDSNTNKTNGSTHFYQLQFANIIDEDDLIEFVCTLPNTGRNSAKTALKKLYKKLDEITEAANTVDLAADGNSSVFYGEKCKLIKCCNDDNAAEILKSLFGENPYKTGKFAFVKKHSFTSSELKDKINGTDTVNKQDIILLCFLYYVIDGGWNELLEELDEKMKKGDKTYSIIQSVYEDFSCLCNEYLEMAGFSTMYLPDPLERTIVFCLMTTDPLKTFTMIIAA